MHKESSVCGQLCTRLGFPATHLKYAQLVHAAPPQPSDLVRRRMAGASSRLLPLQIKPLVHPTALSRAHMSQRLGSGSRASELSCAEPRSFKEIAPECCWWQWGSLLVRGRGRENCFQRWSCSWWERSTEGACGWKWQVSRTDEVSCSYAKFMSRLYSAGRSFLK